MYVYTHAEDPETPICKSVCRSVCIHTLMQRTQKLLYAKAATQAWHAEESKPVNRVSTLNDGSTAAD